MTVSSLMRFRRNTFATLILFAIGLAFSPRSYGQALPTATGPGSYTSVGVTGSLFNVNYGQRWVGGGTLYVDANLYRKTGVEFQLQSLRFHEVSTTRQTTYLAGPRYSFRANRLVPYVKVLAGMGQFTFPYGYGHGNYFVIAPGAGLDFDLSQRLKLRLIDVEYQDWPQFSFGDLHPYGASAGISFRVF
jgi:hypothetical protein